MITEDELQDLVKSTVHRIATQIAELAVSYREEAYAMARLSLEDTIRQTGTDPSTAAAKTMIDIMCEGIRNTVALMPDRGRA